MARSIQYVSPFERALYLKRVTPLSDLTPDHLAVVAQQAEERWYSRGAVIQATSEPVRSFHIVVEGRVHVRGGEHGDEMVGPEQTLGLLSLFARAAEGLEAVAELESRTLEIHSDELDEVLEDHFSILYNEIRDLGCRSLRARMDIETGTHLEPREPLERAPERELDLVERLQLLRSGSIFRNANMDALLGLANRLKEARFDAGETLWDAGDASGFMYAIVHGRVRCTLPDGRWFTAGTGYPLGNLESQCGAPRWYQAVTETPVVALRNSTDALIDLLEDHFETAREFLAAMASGLIRLLRQS
jgi:CRP-like cAMP-binding protein